MKIVHVTEAFEGGVIEFLRCLTNNTPEIEYVIIYGRPQFFEKARPHFPDNVEFVEWKHAYTPIKPRHDAKALRHLVKILKSKKPYDIIHLHSSKAGVLGRIAARFIRHKKVIYAPHGAAFLRKDISKFTRSIYINIERAANLFPAKVIGVSKSEADIYTGIGIKADFVNNGKFFQPKEKNNTTKQKFIIATVGRVTHQKGPEGFNKIASAFADNNEIEFLWIGDGSDKHLLSSPNIKITGWVDKHLVEEYLLQTDLYLSSALWEGLSYAVLEAMSMRLPLLLSHCPGNSDLVENGVNGYLYKKPEEAVEHIKNYVADRELLQKHGETSFAILQTSFSVEQMVEGYRKIYNSL